MSSLRLKQCRDLAGESRVMRTWGSLASAPESQADVVARFEKAMGLGK